MTSLLRSSSNLGYKRWPGRRSFTSRASGVAILTRDFIREALYNPKSGYFASHDVINTWDEPLQFNSMFGERDYRMHLKKAYDAKPAAWMTPAEIFAPFYSETIASYILEQARRHGIGRSAAAPLAVYEVGGGSGTNARAILDFLQRTAPDVYKHTSYTLLEVSGRLAAMQRRRAAEPHPGRCRVVEAAAEDWAVAGMGSGTVAMEATPRTGAATAVATAVSEGSRAEIGEIAATLPCFVLALEVLDNLPHDKVVFVHPG
ncbi:unnamed protein product, partial [Phaeothamnion confervicola]